MHMTHDPSSLDVCRARHGLRRAATSSTAWYSQRRFPLFRLMLRLLRSAAVPAVLLSVLMASPSVGASIVQALDLDELVAHSDRIVLGHVRFSESFQRADGKIATWHRIQVEREIGNDSTDEQEIIVETLGGRVGDLTLQVEGEPSFSLDERVVVFARKRAMGDAYRPVGMGQGVMHVRDEDGIEKVTQSRAGMMLMRPSPDGRWEKSLGALSGTERLEPFLSKVQALVEQGAQGRDE